MVSKTAGLSLGRVIADALLCLAVWLGREKVCFPYLLAAASGCGDTDGGTDHPSEGLRQSPMPSHQ